MTVALCVSPLGVISRFVILPLLKLAHDCDQMGGSNLPEGEEVLDFLLSSLGADVLDVHSVGRHDFGRVGDVMRICCLSFVCEVDEQ